ncbi:16S rRNA methyltransferase [Bifidobacterium ramosum]|uniref:Ribosomal RNA small subunit methyltransferase E n=1 Tax=Bifidobacterium ramosum TaxID=1798158 RepID=A0A6L4WZ30_9BIFI|nr:16S rRNA (uracil(1498)-N(3))-methyltransferase [Bifidobacterium ramosum]KAB8287410.1 16S rRNA methyltransferase [Bifidobacterium ramosum]NEG72130.1 16S rRNA (uracil(1498)-N(3))-methyltransferase [Bifidobacterium ramosum]
MTNPLFLFDPAQDDVPVNSDELNTGWKITLPASVRRHAVQAMRLTDGDEFDLSDGAGLRIAAVLTDAGSGLAEVREVGREPQPVTRLALIQALAKNGHDEQAIDVATQIGVDQVIPWQADRSIAKWKAGRTDRKWDQVLAAATEQSRRAWKPELADCVSSKQVVAICRRACVHGDLVVVLHQDATDTWDGIEQAVRELSDRCLDDGRPRTVNVVVGPEGGIADAEIEQFTAAGARVCVLGTNILRASAAGPVALSLLSRALGRF